MVVLRKILFMFCLSWGTLVFALNTHLIRPVGDQYAAFSLHATQTPKAGTFEVGSIFQYLSNPIDFQRLNINNQNAVESMGVIDSYFNLGFFDWLSIGVLLPINVMGEVNDFNNISQDTGPSLGDLYLHATLRLLEQDKFLGLAVVPFMTLPLDVNRLDQFNDKAPTLGGYLVLDKEILNKHYIGVNLGGQYRFEDESILGSAFIVSNALLYAMAYTYHFNSEKNMDVFVEARGSSNIDNLFTQEETMPIEAIAGLRVRLFKQKLSFVIGGGKGITKAYGSTDYRAFAGISYLGDREVKNNQTDQKKVLEQKPVESVTPVQEKPEVKAPEQISQLFVVIRDEGKKLIMVDMDLINEQGEIVQKYSGTSWRKNTAPGFYTLRVEKKGYETIEKKLQLKLSKRHSYTLTLKKESDDPPMLGNKIDFLGRIQFNSGKATIRPISYTALNQVVTIMKKYPQIKLLRIEAHTDSLGSDSLNLKLSQQRAASVQDFLLASGIESSRLNAIGLGETQPIESNETAEGRAKNRRVEFTVVKAESLNGLNLKK